MILSQTLFYFGAGFLAVIIALLVKLFLRLDNTFDKISQQIPGPPRMPIVGNTFQLLVSSEKLLPLFCKWAAEYGNRFIYRVGTYWVVSLCNPKDVEKLLTSTTETVKSVDYDQLIPWLGAGLLVSKGEKWATRRKLLTPAFHFNILEKFVEVFNEQSFQFLDIIKRKFQPGQEFDIDPLISKLTLDIICETAMGVRIGAQVQDHESEYITAITRLKYFQQYRAFRPWLEPSFIWNVFSYGKEEKSLIEVAHAFTNKVIQQRKADFVPKLTNMADDNAYGFEFNGNKKPAFLDILLQAQSSGHLANDEDVREETDTFMFEGHDTVSTAIGFTLFLIGNHPDVQAKVHAELEQVFGNDIIRPVTTQDLSKLKYLECCIKESLRMCPSVPLVARTIQKNFELEKDIVLPPDTLVTICPYQLHRNPDVYPDPLIFRPERFLSNEQQGKARSPFAFIPFSAGPRNCIGQKFALMEEKVVVANVFRNFTITSVERLDDLTLLSDLILHSKNGIKIHYSIK